ncbi:MAG: arsenic resistance protein [Pseudomonadota bacterium]
MSVAELPERLDQPEAGPAAFGTAVLFILAILIGSGLGLAAPSVGGSLAGGMDATLLTMICLLFFELRLGAVFRAFGNLRFLAIAWCANFVIVPTIGFTIASLVLSGEPLLFAGLMIYFLAPCTDWFLGFTRMARGDTELGAALIPINLITQLALFPLWLWLFTPATGLVDFGSMPGILVQWFVLPLIGAQALRVGLAWILPVKTCERLLSLTSQLLPLVLAALIVQIFGAHVTSITANVDVFAAIAAAVFLFFAANLYLGAGLARFSRLAHPQHVLLSMTLAARNAPLMLALTAVAIPDQPLVLAVIVFGMLVEIPHLTALKQLLLRRSPTKRGGLDVRRTNHI